MRRKYSKDADTLIISLREGKLADSIDLKEGDILHLDDNGLPLEIEIFDAAVKTALSSKGQDALKRGN